MLGGRGATRGGKSFGKRRHRQPVRAEAVVGPFRKVGLPEAREKDEVPEIAALRAPSAKIAFEFEHLPLVLFGLKRRARVWRVRVGVPNVDRTVDDMCM